MILVVLAVVTFIFLPDIQNPPESSPGGLAQGVEVASVDQPNPPGDRKFLTIGVNGQQYLWRYDYPGDDNVFSYYELVVPIKTTVVLKITLVRRDPLVVDPQARRQGRWRSGLHERDLVQDRQAGHLTRASAPSSAASTTLTCAPSCAPSSRPSTSPS